MNNNGVSNETSDSVPDRNAGVCNWVAAYAAWNERRERGRSAFQRDNFIGFTVQRSAVADSERRECLREQRQ